MQIIKNDMGWETKIYSGDHFFEKSGPRGPKFSVKKLVPRTIITGTKIPVTSPLSTALQTSVWFFFYFYSERNSLSNRNTWPDSGASCHRLTQHGKSSSGHSYNLGSGD